MLNMTKLKMFYIKTFIKIWSYQSSYRLIKKAESLIFKIIYLKKLSKSKTKSKIQVYISNDTN